MEASNLRPHTKHTHIILLWNIRKYKPNIHATDSDTQTHTHTRGNQVQKHFSLQMNLLIIMKKKLQKITKKKILKFVFRILYFRFLPSFCFYIFSFRQLFLSFLFQKFTPIFGHYSPPPLKDPLVSENGRLTVHCHVTTIKD